MNVRKVIGSIFLVLLVIVVFWMWPKDGSPVVSAQYPPYPCPNDPLTNPYLCRDTNTPDPNGYPYPYPVDATPIPVDSTPYPYPVTLTPTNTETSVPTPSSTPLNTLPDNLPKRPTPRILIIQTQVATMPPVAPKSQNPTGADNKPANIPVQSNPSEGWIVRALEQFSIFLRSLGR